MKSKNEIEERIKVLEVEFEEYSEKATEFGAHAHLHLLEIGSEIDALMWVLEESEENQK